MKNINVLCFLVFAVAFNSAGATGNTPVSDVISSVIYLGGDTPKDTYGLILEAQKAWMESSRKDCDAQTSEIGSSSSRNEQYGSCLSSRYFERKKYLAQFLCGAGVVSDEPCDKEGDLTRFLISSKDVDTFSKRMRGFLFENGQLDKARTLAVLDFFVADRLVSGDYITTSTAPAFNDIGYAMSESGVLDGAYTILSEVEKKSSDRLVLKLNIADTLWGLNQKEKAKNHYKNYMSGMNAAGKSSAVPARVLQRLADK